MNCTAIAKKVLSAARSVHGVVIDPEVTHPGTVATFGPGERVPHVAVRPTGTGVDVEVHLCVRPDFELSLPELAHRVRRVIRIQVEAIGASVGRIDVAFDDVRTEEGMGA